MTTPDDIEPFPGVDTDARHSNGSDPSTTTEGVITGLTAEVRRFHERAEFFEAINKKMHDRIEVLEGDIFRSSLRPIVKALAELHGESQMNVQRARSDGDSEIIDVVAEDFLTFAERIEELLDGLGIVSVGARIGDQFDPKIHNSCKAIDTDDESDHRRVQKIYHQGFRDASSDKPIVYAKVSVWNYRSP